MFGTRPSGEIVAALSDELKREVGTEAVFQSDLLVAIFLPSICHDVLGLNYLDGMSKSAADGDAVACAAADRPEQAGKLDWSFMKAREVMVRCLLGQRRQDAGVAMPLIAPKERAEGADDLIEVVRAYLK